MTEEQYIDLKDNYIEHLTKMMSSQGEIYPHITVFADHIDPKDSEKPAVIHMLIPPEHMESEDAKDEFVNEKLPPVFKEMKQRWKPYCISWAAEAWVRTVSKDFDMEKENWKAIPIKKEVVIISMETEDSSETIIYNIHREGKQGTEDGDLVDRIRLELDEDLKGVGASAGGRFTGLFRTFKNI